MITSAVSIMVKVVSTAVTCLKLRHYFAMINHITTSFSVWQMFVQCLISQISKDTHIEFTCTSRVRPYRPMFTNLSPCNSFLLNHFDHLQSKQKQTNKLISFVHWLEQFFFVCMCESPNPNPSFGLATRSKHEIISS